MQGEVLKRLDDNDWAVRRQLAASLGELPAATKEAAIATMLERHGDDPIAVDAALSGCAGSELAVLDRLLQGTRKRRSGPRPSRCSRPQSCTAAEDAPMQALMQRVAETSRAAMAARRAFARCGSLAARRDDAG